MAENLFAVLGVTPSVTQEQLAAAFREVSRENHPDVGGDALQYQEVVDAYNALKDPSNRAAYIKWLELTQSQCPSCKGLGIRWQQRGFRGGEFSRCPICKGAGFHDTRTGSPS